MVLISAKYKKSLEARVGIEPTHKGFADLSLTTWVPRLDSSTVTCSALEIQRHHPRSVPHRLIPARWRLYFRMRQLAKGRVHPLMSEIATHAIVTQLIWLEDVCPQ